MSVKDEIGKAIASLGLAEHAIAEVPERERAALFASFRRHFTGGVDAR